MVSITYDGLQARCGREHACVQGIWTTPSGSPKYASMQSKNPVISDFVKLANSAAGTFAGMARETQDAARERIKAAMGGMDFVSREEFDAVKDMAAKAREEAEALKERVAALEAKHAGE